MKWICLVLMVLSGSALAGESLDQYAVFVLSGVRVGSGVAITRDKIATACHTLGDAGMAVVADRSGRLAGYSTLVTGDPVRDICILNLDRPHGIAIPVRGSSKNLQTGQLLNSVAFEDGRAVVKAGRVMDVRTQSNGYPVINTEIAFKEGASGGGVFDTDGRVIGIVSYVQNDSRGKRVGNFAIPIEWVNEVVLSDAVPIGILRTGREFWRN